MPVVPLPTTGLTFFLLLPIVYGLINLIYGTISKVSILFFFDRNREFDVNLIKNLIYFDKTKSKYITFNHVIKATFPFDSFSLKLREKYYNKK